ncbi:MAG TPA: SH3 domain-containing protein [Paracoccaceae bacterium]
MSVGLLAPAGRAQTVEGPPVAVPDAVAQPAPAAAARDPNRGAVTSLPLPRYVTLKTGEGNARRGPGLSHRIDWVFTRAGMPLRITAEHENWRRVEDNEGAGGWVHYSLLSGVRAVLVAQDLAQFHAIPDDQGVVVVQAEAGVIARLLECQPDWCRLSAGGEKGWVRKSALWGVDPGEVVE